jgi:hypothetical protein
MNCGREPGGRRAQEIGICPASVEIRLDGVHDGTNAGRSCWMIAGTLCGGDIQGTFAKKYKNCSACEFYSRVREEESPYFQLSAVLLTKINTTA